MGGRGPTRNQRGTGRHTTARAAKELCHPAHPHTQDLALRVRYLYEVTNVARRDRETTLYALYAACRNHGTVARREPGGANRINPPAEGRSVRFVGGDFSTSDQTRAANPKNKYTPSQNTPHKFTLPYREHQSQRSRRPRIRVAFIEP